MANITAKELARKLNLDATTVEKVLGTLKSDNDYAAQKGVTRQYIQRLRSLGKLTTFQFGDDYRKVFVVDCDENDALFL